MENEKQYRKGYFIELGIVIGLPLGVAIGIALGIIAFGPLIGVVLGLITGVILEKKLNKNPVEQSEQIKAKKRKFYLVTFIIGLIFFAGILTIYILNK